MNEYSIGNAPVQNNYQNLEKQMATTLTKQKHINETMPSSPLAPMTQIKRLTTQPN